MVLAVFAFKNAVLSTYFQPSFNFGGGDSNARDFTQREM